ncbi:hypothetical protein [Vibrio owensii]|uniref:hypothetical protein n=1 Tax=Vibrio owensii TaxID=696485 RepID=UPI0018F10B4B|nr:hypothetical protein [Vibrio owensii]
MTNGIPFKKYTHRLISGYQMHLETHNEVIILTTPEFSATYPREGLKFEITDTGNPSFQTLTITSQEELTSIAITINNDIDDLLKTFLTDSSLVNH